MKLSFLNEKKKKQRIENKVFLQCYYTFFFFFYRQILTDIIWYNDYNIMNNVHPAKLRENTHTFLSPDFLKKKKRNV